MIIQLCVKVIIPFLISLSCIPCIIIVSKRFNLYDTVNLERKFHKGNISRLGGVVIFFGFISSFLVLNLFELNFHFNLKLYLAGMSILFLTGLYDDIFHLSSKNKLLMQIVAAVIVVSSGLVISEIYFFDIVYLQLNYYTGSLFTILLILVYVNAVNLIDGMDGLASGLFIITSIIIGIVSFQYGNYLVSAIMTIGGSAALGFYIINLKKKIIFLGDSGAYLLGFIIATVPIMQDRVIPETGNIYSLTSLTFIIWIVPILDVLYVIIIRLKHGKSIISGDTNHIHHRLKSVGLTEKKILAVLYGTSILLGFTSIIPIKKYYFSNSYVHYQLFIVLLVLFSPDIVRKYNEKGSVPLISILNCFIIKNTLAIIVLFKYHKNIFTLSIDNNKTVKKRNILFGHSMSYYEFEVNGLPPPVLLRFLLIYQKKLIQKNWYNYNKTLFEFSLLTYLLLGDIQLED